MRTKPKTNLLNREFGKLTVIAEAPNRGKHTYWVCVCDCGKIKEIASNHLKRGRSQTCGCSHIKHGMAETAELICWKNMIGRCYGKQGLKNYKGRGIIVCERWRNSFMDFYKDMGPKPSPELSLDRINNDGNYEPGNCRWATDIQQRNNQRKPKEVAYKLNLQWDAI